MFFLNFRPFRKLKSDFWDKEWLLVPNSKPARRVSKLFVKKIFIFPFKYPIKMKEAIIVYHQTFTLQFWRFWRTFEHLIYIIY